ncbi:MAG: hypothetical protein IJ054_09325 [Lachnospiraceae bacterium]|nr:hypothetical protein [Lachnospiraceae bacterium]
MAKDKRDREEKKGIGASAIVIMILIILLFLTLMALLIKCDVGGFGSEVLRPVFKDIPIINKILPDASDEEVAKESDYPYSTLSEALDQIKIMDEQLNAKDAEILGLNDKVAELTGEVEQLSTYKTEQEDFEAKKNQFYDEIVYGDYAPDADTYIEWYNEISPERAEEIYESMILARQADDEILELAKTYEEMKAKNAADILQTMKNDTDTVALIMNNMSAEKRADVLAAMEPDFAASITKKLLP